MRKCSNVSTIPLSLCIAIVLLLRLINYLSRTVGSKHLAYHIIRALLVKRPATFELFAVHNYNDCVCLCVDCIVELVAEDNYI